MKLRLTNWPKLVFIVVPLLIVIVDAVVLVGERLEPETQKAIRLVRESNSRKENFTVQQYLYTTVYHRKSQGEPITIEGWRATASAVSDETMTVEFSYEDATGRHVANWDANLADSSVIPKSQVALDLSWH